MAMAVLKQDNDVQGQVLTGEAFVFDKLRELTRNGYLPDAEAPASGHGILLRHSTGPDLILQPDGTIDLPITQTTKSAPALAEASAPPRRLAWLRTLMIVILAATFWFLSVAFTATIFEGM